MASSAVPTPAGTMGNMLKIPDSPDAAKALALLHEVFENLSPKERWRLLRGLREVQRFAEIDTIQLAAREVRNERGKVHRANVETGEMLGVSVRQVEKTISEHGLGTQSRI